MKKIYQIKSSLCLIDDIKFSNNLKKFDGYWYEIRKWYHSFLTNQKIYSKWKLVYKTKIVNDIFQFKIKEVSNA